MTTDQPVEKLLTYVFEDDAPLPDAPFTLADGLFLAPIPQFLLVKDTEWPLLEVNPRFSQFYEDHLHSTTLNIGYMGRADLNDEGVKSAEHDAYSKSNNYLLAAMIHAPYFLPPYACFSTIVSQQRVCNSKRMKDFGRLASSNQMLAAGDFDVINQLYSALAHAAPDGATGRIPTAVRYYQQAFRKDVDWSIRFLSMMMAMEALLSHGASEISHQVSERTAFLLRATAPDREAVYDEMRKAYKLRSTIAHGGTTRQGQEELERSFQQLLLLLRESLLKVLTDAALRELFQSANSNQFNKAMRNLVFRGRAEVD